MDVGENRLIYMGLFENEVPSISIKIAISYGLLTMVYHIFGKTCIGMGAKIYDLIFGVIILEEM